MAVFQNIVTKLGSINPLSAIFRKNKIELDNINDMSVGKSQEEMEVGMGPGDYMSASVNFAETFQDKTVRITKYREMSMYSEVNDALDNICDDAINTNDEDEILSLQFDEKRVPKAIANMARKEFDYLTQRLFKTEERTWDLFRKWLIESELFIELILNKKKNRIVSTKILPAYTMSPIYDGNKITGFKQTNVNAKDSTKDIIFESNQILYINYGTYGKNILDVRGYLESAVKPYNQLRNIEDSLVVYRLVRAPERRVWNIDTGKMPKGKAEEYIKKLITQYKKRLNYDSTTGNIDTTAAVQAMTEDFWFAKTESGGSTVESLQSGIQLGEIEDVKYFLQKLYKSLKLPKSRYEETANYGAGKISEVTREEIKFSMFIERLQNRFKYIYIDTLLLQLKLNGVDKKYLNSNIFDVSFNKLNLYKEWKEKEIIEQMINTWSSVSSYVITPDNASDGVFSREFAMKHFLRMSEEDYKENDRLRKVEMKRLGIDFPNAGMGDEDGEDTSFGGAPKEPVEPKEPVDGEDSENV